MSAVSASLPSSFHAAVLRRFGEPLVIERLAMPEPGPDQVLIRVRACGVCHSDLHAVDGDWRPQPVLPLTPGHEATGQVVAMGANVQGLKLGDWVGVPWMFSACGRCEQCLSGREVICPNGHATGYSVPGGYADHMVAPADYVGRLPQDGDPYALAPILCAGVTVYRAIKRSEARPGQWLAVIGCGGLGHVALQYGSAMGLRTAAIDIDPAKLALAKSLGAEFTGDAGEADLAKNFRKAIGGAHGVLVTTPNPKAFDLAIKLARPGGAVVFVGLPSFDQDKVPISVSSVIGRELTIRGSAVGTRQDLQEAIDFAAAGKVTSRIEKVPFAQCNEALARMRAGKFLGRLVLDMGA